MGKTLIYKENHIIFKTGEKAECMYIIRKGSVKVYFEKENEEVTLATLKEGAIVGEMAFFDQQPRSASVKTLEACEITEVTKDDFQKLLTQMPKWMVTIMQSLSQRLRTTNDKLKSLEGASGLLGSSQKGALILPNQHKPYEHMFRAMKVVLLAIAKEGIKEAKEASVIYENVRKIWIDFFTSEGDILEKILKVAEEGGLLTRKPNSIGQDTVTVLNKGALTHFVENAPQMFGSLSPLRPIFEASFLELLSALYAYVNDSGQASLVLNLDNFISEKNPTNADEWKKAIDDVMAIPLLKNTGPKKDNTVRIAAKDLKQIIQYAKIIKMFHDKSLA